MSKALDVQHVRGDASIRLAVAAKPTVAARSIGYRHENETSAVSLAQRGPAETELAQPIEITGGPAWTRTRNQTVMSGRL
jgi:hypothetical protein